MSANADHYCSSGDEVEEGEQQEDEERRFFVFGAVTGATKPPLQQGQHGEGSSLSDDIAVPSGEAKP